MKPPQLRVLHQDEHLVAIYKPAGWLVHRTGLDAHETRFVVQALRNQLGRHVYPAHRIDKGTCGVLLLGLNADVARTLALAFAGRTVAKRYLALVRGWPPEECTVDHALRPDDAAPDAPAQPAQTRIYTLQRFAWPQAADPRFTNTRLALVQAEPFTGRRHQIRRHLKHMAHPILGDATHGKGPLNRWWAAQVGPARLWLHAWQLTLPHPVTGATLHLHSGLPEAWVRNPAGAQHTPPQCAVPASDLIHWQAQLQALAPWQALE